MLKKLITLVFGLVVAFPLATAAFAQDAAATAKEARVEGTIIRSSTEKSTLTVRKVGSMSSTSDKTVQYDASTRWVSQAHGAPKATDIMSTDVKDGDRVICTGTLDKNGVLHATLISKRLTGAQSKS
jgi:hypothetical protein